MRIRSLGADGPTVAAVGAGDVSLARAAARGVDAGEVELALCAAIEAGVGLIEVAVEPDAERVVGDVVRTLRVRDRVVAAFRPPTTRELVRHVEASLRASRLDVLPLVLLPLARPASPDLRGACERIVRDGKVLRWGAYIEAIDEPEPGDTDDDADGEAGDEPVAAKPAQLDGDWLCAVSAPLSLCERAAASWKDIVVLARRPLAGAALAGALGPGAKLAREDDRRGADLARAALAAAKLAAFVKREPPAARSTDAARAQLERNVRPAHVDCLTVAELALRWVIDRGAIALPRLHRRDHIAEAIAAAAAPPLANDVPELDI